MFEITYFCWSNWKLPGWETPQAKTVAWSYDMKGHAQKCVERYSDLAKQESGATITKFQVLAWIILKSSRNNSKQLENCQKFGDKLSWHACTWHELEDLTFYGRSTSLHDRSRNGPKLVTNDYVVWSLTFIKHVHTNCIAMWETLPNDGDWDCFKTPILQEVSRTQNLLQVEHCAFWEVIHLFQYVGCVRSKHQFQSVEQNQKSFLRMPDWD